MSYELDNQGSGERGFPRTPYQVALARHNGIYLGYDVDVAGAVILETAIQASLSAQGKIRKGRLRSQYDDFASREVGEGGWQASERVHQFYDRALFDGLPGLIGATEACLEMKRAHLRRLVSTAPFNMKLDFLSRLLITYGF